MKEILIAPCGMNCSLCIAYQFREKDLNKQGFHRTYCPGCIPRAKNCTHMGDQCELLGKGIMRFCYEYEAFPCKRLKSLDKRYRTKYHMSIIENLKFIQENGMDMFLKKEEIKWRCPDCDGVICCHNGLCMNCNLDTLRQNRKYRWNGRHMNSLNNHIQEYNTQLSKGQIQKAYKGIMTFMSGLIKYLRSRYPDHTTSAFYFGYMDMTYFAFTPSNLKSKKLKIAIVYLHEEGRFEVWLGGSNKKIQAEYINLMRCKNIGKYKLSQVLPGVDSIIASILAE
jgi:hypothetical protein